MPIFTEPTHTDTVTGKPVQFVRKGTMQGSAIVIFPDDPTPTAVAIQSLRPLWAKPAVAREVTPHPNRSVSIPGTNGEARTKRAADGTYMILLRFRNGKVRDVAHGYPSRAAAVRGFRNGDHRNGF